MAETFSTEGLKGTIKKSFYSQSQGVGHGKTIEMPPEGYVLGGPPMIPDVPSVASEPEPSPFGAVPAELPKDVSDAIAEQQPEIAEPEVEEPAPVEEVQPETIVAKTTPKDSFRNIREAKEKAERERDAILTQMLDMQAKINKVQEKQVAAEPEYNDSDFNIDEDALVEGKYVKKVVSEIKNLKSQLKNYQAQSAQIAIESKIKAHYPDFEAVVSPENVEILNAQFPDIAASLRDTQDMYAKASAAYTVIKRFGIGQIREEDMAKKIDKAKAIVNAAKPRPLASVSPQQGDSPLSKANAFANGLTPELQKQLLKEMMDAKKLA